MNSSCHYLWDHQEIALYTTSELEPQEALYKCTIIDNRPTQLQAFKPPKEIKNQNNFQQSKTMKV